MTGAARRALSPGGWDSAPPSAGDQGGVDDDVRFGLRGARATPGAIRRRRSRHCPSRRGGVRGLAAPATHAFHRGAEAFARRQQRMHQPGDTLLEKDGWPVRLISVDYGKTMGRWWRRGSDRARWRDALSVMKRRSPHQLLRVHNVPPDSGVVAQLLAAGVDLVGATNVQAFRRLVSRGTHGPAH
jgi:hypothetical protein